MTPFFSTDARRQDLVRAALDWRDTPFVNHGMVKHAGVDCVHLVAAILIETGALKQFQWPNYSLDSGAHSKESALLAWMDNCPSFSKLPTWTLSDIAAGDAICFNLKLSEHHLGLMLDEGGGPGASRSARFIHVLPQRRVIVSTFGESYYVRRITAVYRPVSS
jgi:hypothetical protein